MFAYCANSPVSSSDDTGHFGVLIAVTALVVVTVAIVAGNDAYQIFRTDGKGVSVRMAEYEVEITNSYKVISPIAQYGYAFYVNHFSEYKDEIKGTTSGIQFEWAMHNSLYYATSTLKQIGCNSEKLDAWNNKTESTGIGKTIYSDFKSGHGFSSKVMNYLYRQLRPVSSLVDYCVEMFTK